jgi:nucleoside-diphosphate-sugar epimerase
VSRGILVTGAAGFIGGALVRHFSSQGWRTIGAGRRKPPDFPAEAEWRDYDLAWTSLPGDFFGGVDVLIHAAMVRGEAGVNVAGSTLLLDEAQRRGVGQVAFLSSLAAHDAALSTYGRHKYLLQQLYESRGALVIRPGLVTGAGGAFQAMYRYLQRSRFVPLVDGGKQPLQSVFIDDLVEAIDGAIARHVSGTFTVAEEPPVAYCEFYRCLCQRATRSIVFVPVPSRLLLAGVGIAERLRFSLPIDRDNVLGLVAMRPDHGRRLHPPGRMVGDYRHNIAAAGCLPEPAP